MNQMFHRFARFALLFGLISVSVSALSNEALIRKNLSERMQNFPSIDEVRKTPMEGIFEVRTGNGVYYTDRTGEHLIAGVVLATKTQTNLTEASSKQMAAKRFSALPVNDAIKVVRGNGRRKLAVFADPNCGYCKKLELDLAKLENVTVYTFLYPILGQDSVAKSRGLWCSRNRAEAWSDWMLKGRAISAAAEACNAAAIDRTVALGRSLGITGTPAIFLGNGDVIKGAAELSEIEARLSAGP